MCIEFRELNWAVVASQHRSLRKAAEVLNVRQSTLSRSLRDLERRLGASIFERSNGGTRPTLAGQEFLEAVQRVIHETDVIAKRLHARSQGESGRLTIGIQVALSAGNLRATLIEHRLRFPDVELSLVDGTSERLISDLGNSNADAAFVIGRDIRWSGRSLPVWSERLVAAIPDSHRLAGNQVVAWGELNGQSIMVPQRGPGPEFINLLASKVGGTENYHLQRHDTSLDRLLTLVGAGLGILVVLEGATGASYPGVVFREVHDFDGPTRLSFNVIWREDNANPSLLPFLGIVRERYPDFSRDPPSV